MSRDTQLKERWEKLVQMLSDQFSQGEDLDLDAIIYLIGVQELGSGQQKYSKDDKLNILHIAVCRLLEPFGYYKFSNYDDDGYPHFEEVEKLPELKPNEQQILMKKAIIQYFIDEELL